LLKFRRNRYAGAGDCNLSFWGDQCQQGISNFWPSPIQVERRNADSMALQQESLVYCDAGGRVQQNAFCAATEIPQVSPLSCSSSRRVRVWQLP
jgi:hypothetical protein